MDNNFKINDTSFRCISQHYNYWLNQDSANLLEAEKFFRDKLGFELSVVKRPDGGWNCFVMKTTYPYNIPSQKIVFQDSWSNDFSYEEAMDNLIFYYFVDLGYIRLPRTKSEENSITLHKSDFGF